MNVNIANSLIIRCNAPKQIGVMIIRLIPSYSYLPRPPFVVFYDRHLLQVAPTLFRADLSRGLAQGSDRFLLFLREVEAQKRSHPRSLHSELDRAVSLGLTFETAFRAAHGLSELDWVPVDRERGDRVGGDGFSGGDRLLTLELDLNVELRRPHLLVLRAPRENR